MGFNLGAFAGGAARSGMKAYTTLEEIELKRAAEERDKARFAEEQRLIQQRIGSEDIARKAAIPEIGGMSVNEVTSALPIFAGDQRTLEQAGGEAGQTRDRAKFQEVFGSLTPQQQEMVLRGYGDAATPGGQRIAEGALGRQGTEAGTNTKFDLSDEAVGKYKNLAALNLGTTSVRQGAEGNYAVQPIAVEKEIIANHKKLAMQSGNPIAIKAAQDSEISYLTREVGKQNIELNDYNIKKVKSAEEFKNKFNKEMEGAKKSHFETMKEIDEELTSPDVSLNSLVAKFGSKFNNAYSVKDGKIVSVDADGKPTVVASDINQAGQLLKDAAINNFGKDFQNRILKNGLFETPTDLAAFIAAERKFINDTATLATARITAAAATSNAATNAGELAEKIKAGLYPAQAQRDKDTGAAAKQNARNTADHYAYLKKQAEEKSNLEKEARAEVVKITDAFAKLSPAEKEGQKGQDLMIQGAMAIARKTGDITGVLNAMKRPDKNIITDPSKFVELFGTMPSQLFKDSDSDQAIPINKLSPSQLLEEMQLQRGDSGARALPDPKVENMKKTSAAGTTGGPAAAAAAPPYTPIAGSAAAIAVAERQALANAKKQSAQEITNAASTAATAAITANNPIDARKVQEMDGFSSLPIPVQAQVQKIVMSISPNNAKAAAPTAAATPAAIPVPPQALANAEKRLAGDAKTPRNISEKDIQAEMAAIRATPSAKGMKESTIREIAITMLSK